MSLFARIILWGLLLLMLKDARSQSRTQSCNMEVGYNKAGCTISPTVTEAQEANPKTD
jgi:hypothetical protein